MDSRNIGQTVRNLLHTISERLQGRGNTVEEELASADKNIKECEESLEKGGFIINGEVHPFGESGREDYERGLVAARQRRQNVVEGGAALIAKEQREWGLHTGDSVQNSHFLIFTEQRDKPLKGKRERFARREWEYVPGVYNVKTWYGREDIRAHCRKQGLALPAIEYYAKIERLQAVHQEREKAWSEAHAKLEARLAELGIGFFDKRSKVDALAKRLHSLNDNLFEQEQFAEEDLQAVRDRSIYVFKELDESQIHWYGNRLRNVPSNYVGNVTPLTAKNVGEELHYAFAEFLKEKPKGAKGKDLSQRNVPFVLQGSKGIYAVRLGSKGPLVFRDITLADIKKLTE